MEAYHGKAPNKLSLHRRRCTRSLLLVMRPPGRRNDFKKFVPRFRVVDNIEKPLKIYCDNEPAVQYSYNNKKSDASKHINIKYYVVKEKIQDHTINLEHISTKQMLADLFTKDLPPNMFKEHVAGMSLRESI
jgi:hypothetical protein